MLGCIRPLATFAFALLLAACVENDVRRGNDALRIGDYDRAVTSFNKALDSDPANRDARYGLALSYYAIAEASERLRVPTFDLWSLAAKEFRILSNIDSSEKINANYSTCLFYLARAALKRDGTVDVMPMLDQSIQLDSLNYFSYNLKALILAQSDIPDNLKTAKNIYIHIITHDPNFASAYINLGNIYWDEGDVESAWDTWSAGLQKSPENQSLIYWTHVAEDSLKAMVLSGRL